MDLSKLSWFFEHRVEDCRRRLIESIPPQANAECDYLSLLTDGLLRSLFGLTHKMLLAQYKLIQRDVSFDDFCESLRRAEIRGYLHGRYPVLAPWMEIACARWVEQSSLLVNRFIEDEAEIRKLLGAGGRLQVRAIQFGLGDPHRGGRTVALLVFTDGSKVLYKPRSLSIDSHLGELLEWVNAHSGMGLVTPRHVDRGSYGWVEFVEYLECDDEAGICRFYERLGGLLALLYALEGTDFHYENLIASADQPVLIDLETFFHPAAPISGTETNNDIDYSILKVGLLPSRVDAAEQHFPEISGIADVEGQTGLESMHLARSEDGGYEFVRDKGRLLGAKNVPKLHGEKVRLSHEHVGHLQQGFRAIYELILGRKEEFKGLLEPSRNDQVRVLFRHTATYVHLLGEANHPSLMASQADIDAHFGLLKLVIPDFKVAERFVYFEMADLHRCDVPMFTTKVDSRHLWYADENFVADFFPKSGYESVLSKLDSLSAQDMGRQLWVIGSVLAMRDNIALGAPAPPPPASTTVDASFPSLDDRLVAQAERIAGYVESSMHVDGEFASWLVYTAASLDNKEVELHEAFYDLHSGMPGEILFLSQLADITGNPWHRSLAQKALNFLMFRLEQSRASIRPLGMFAGWGSVIFMLTSLARLENDPRYFEQVEHIFDTVDLESLIAVDRNFGLYKGSAGLVLTCAEYHMASGSRRATAFAEAAAEHLLANRDSASPGSSWRITSASPLSGVAHGASGFAMAFARLYQATRNARYRDASLESLEYERTLYVPEAGNWQDLRDSVVNGFPGEVFCSNAWAHGAPGIGLARLALLDAGIESTELLRELETAVQTTLTKAFLGNDLVISGCFGNLDLLISYVERFGNERLADLAPLVERLLDRIDRHGWQLGGKGVPPLGFMVGVTGVGYQCLRMAGRNRVPSILRGASRPFASRDFAMDAK